jgi:hypothetical protein
LLLRIRPGDRAKATAAVLASRERTGAGNPAGSAWSISARVSRNTSQAAAAPAAACEMPTRKATLPSGSRVNSFPHSSASASPGGWATPSPKAAAASSAESSRYGVGAVAAT